MTRDPALPPSSAHNNADLLVWALHQCGGTEKWVDVEELYLRAFELAPARLSWRTRPDLPDYKKCAKALQELEDPKRSDHLGLLAKNGQYSRKLTMEGATWCERFADRLHSLYGGSDVPSAPSQDDGRRVRTIVQSVPFDQWTKTGESTAPLWELAELFRCMPDSAPATWHSRLDEHLLAARRNSRGDVVAFIDAVRARLEVEL